MSVKENIPILDIPQLFNETRNKRSKNIMENQSRTSNEIPLISDRVVNCSTIDNDLVTTKSISQLAENIDNKEMDTKSDKNRIQAKVPKYDAYYKYILIIFNEKIIVGFTSWFNIHN